MTVKTTNMVNDNQNKPDEKRSATESTAPSNALAAAATTTDTVAQDENNSNKLNGGDGIEEIPAPVKKRPGIIELGDVTPHNIKLLRRLNQVIFPVTYNAKFYKDVLESGPLAKLAYYNDVMVGAVCCRVDASEPNTRRLYIMTLGCLAFYRRLGIGSKMVQHILDYVTTKDTNFDSIFLHVQINNEDAIEFYKKFGFEIIETRKNYYKRIEPPDAHVLSKNLKKSN